MKFKIVLSIYLLVLSVIFIPVRVNARNFTAYSFTNEDGLASNLTKSITQDNNGFIWIATDAGISKFDGRNFVNYQNDLPSLYIKNIYCTQSNKIIVATDLGIGYFIKKNGKYKYIPIQYSSRSINDSSVYYPKKITQTKDGTIWIGDLSGISKLKNGKLKKYLFPDKYHADSYFRAFSIAQNGRGDIIASSRNGYLFLYDKKKDKFDLLSFRPPDKRFRVDALIKNSFNSFLLGTSEGVYNLIVNPKGAGIKIKKLSNVPNVSAIAEKDSSKIFFGTWDGKLYFAKLEGKLKDLQVINHHIDDVNFSSVKNLFIDRDKNVWVCSDEGVSIIKESLFNTLKFNSSSGEQEKLFIQQIHIDNDDNVYFTDGSALYEKKVVNGKYRVVKLLNIPNVGILDFVVSDKGLWISYRNNLLEFRNKNNLKVIHTWNLKDDRFNTLYVDKKDNLWAFLARRDQIVKIDKSFNLKYFNLKYKDLVFINAFKEDTKGNLYCGGVGVDSYLLKFDKAKQNFVSISPKSSFGKNSSVQVFDLYPKDSVIYLATGFGVLKVINDSLEKIKDTFSIENSIARSITFDKNNVMWVGTEKGVCIYTGNQNTYFDVHDGLPNSSVVNQGIIFDKNNTMWVATASGVAYAHPLDNSFNKTPKPIFTNIKELLQDGKNLDNSRKEFVSGVNLEFVYNSLIFPNQRTYYQYRMLGLDSVWSALRLTNYLNFISLPSGHYILQVRAKSVGHFTSNISNFDFNIVPHWYFSKLMLFIYAIVSILLIILIVNRVNSIKFNRIKEREHVLAQLVNEKTNDLLIEKERVENLLAESEKAKKQLEEATEQKSTILNIAAHDLKNPLQSLIGFSSIIKDESKDEEIKNMSRMIFESSQAMLSQINDMLEAAAMESKNLSLDLKTVDVNQIVKSVIKTHSERAKQKDQIIINKFEDDVKVQADNHWLSIAVDNLLSNAIKYSEKGKTIYLSTAKNKNNVYIKVKDQGPGLTDEDMNKLFAKYQRLSAKPTANESSTGLGLSIVKDIIDKHKGKVWAESELGKGTTFIISIPINNKSTG